MVIGDLNDVEDSPALTQQLQTLDHIFVSDGLHAGVDDVRYVHFDNDYFERDETRRAAGVSDHDPPLVTIALPSRR